MNEPAMNVLPARSTATSDPNGSDASTTPDADSSVKPLTWPAAPTMTSPLMSTARLSCCCASDAPSTLVNAATPSGHAAAPPPSEPDPALPLPWSLLLHDEQVPTSSGCGSSE
ncbi:MAG TPA: hypothetical protein VFT22_32370 [Kofleriaceae bacterium]|nr:hypothetical protein [Kofleriaceae bacterium]